MDVEFPEKMSDEMRSLLQGLLQREVTSRLGCEGRGATEVREHPFFKTTDWNQVYYQKVQPPLIPPRGEVNAADAFDIGSFDEDDVKGIKLSEADQELYKNFPVTISERWQQEIAETIFETVNQEHDKLEMKRKAKKMDEGIYAMGKDCIMHGILHRLGGPFLNTWQKRYFYLFPNRLEWSGDGDRGPSQQNVIALEDVLTVEESTIKGYKSITLKMKAGKPCILRAESEPEYVQWFKDIRSTFDEAQRMLRKGPKMFATQATGMYYKGRGVTQES